MPVRREISAWLKRADRSRPRMTFIWLMAAVYAISQSHFKRTPVAR